MACAVSIMLRCFTGGRCLQEDTRNSFLRPPTNVVLERELRRDTSLRKGDANGSALGSLDETSVFASHDQSPDGHGNGAGASINGKSQAAVTGALRLCPCRSVGGLHCR